MSANHPLMRLLAGFRASEPLGKQGRSFELLMAWWLLYDPEFGAKFGRVEKPARDIGIDLIAYPRDGSKPTAVQCKQHTADIPKSEINSFLSAAATDDYADSLLIHTGTGFSPNAEATITRQQTPCRVVTLARLLRSDVEWPDDIDKLKTGAPLAARQPRPHQQEAIASIRSVFRSGGARTWVDMACGSGKTLVGSLTADEFADDLAVVLLATIPAVHETVRAWRRDSHRPFLELRVCSQQEAGDREILSFEDAHAAVTTSQEQIELFLRSGGRRVVFCTYASAPRLARAALAAGVRFDLMVADDVHRLSSRRKSDEARSVLADDCLSARRRLFMTATPRSFDPPALRLAARRGAPLVDMRDFGGGDFGRRAYRLSHREAVERKAVLPFEVHVVRITTAEVDHIIASRRMVAAASHSEAVLASLAATQIAVIKAAADLQLKRLVAFHAHVAESKTFARQFEATASLVRGAESVPTARHVDRGDSRRRRTIQWFETSETACLLSNQKLLAEGIDSPIIDAIIWNDPRPPPNRLVQAIGRALRPAPGKSKAFVIVPMVVGPDGNVERDRYSSTFYATLKILDALRTIDPEFTFSRESLRLYAAKRPHAVFERSVSAEELIVAPLEVTDAFADAIEPRMLPVKAPALRPVSSDAPGSRPRRATHRGPTEAPSAQVRPRLPLDRQPSQEVFANGLERLEASSGDQLIFGLDDTGWLHVLRHRFNEKLLRDDQLERVASHISFLASGLGPRNSELRAAIARNADRSVPEQLVAWIRAHPSTSRAHALHAVAYSLRWPIDEFVFQLHSRLTHPGIDPVSQARLCLQPLLVATDRIGREEDPTNRVAGVLAALEYPWDAPPRAAHGWHPEATTDVGRADWQTYEAGWEAAQPWRAQARLISRLDLKTHEHGILWAVARETQRPCNRRWDYTAWVVYIDELVRTGGERRAAARTASMLPYSARAQRTQRLIATPTRIRAAA